MQYLRPTLVAALAALSLAACERKKAPEPTVPAPEVLAADAAQSGLLAAAEPFEVLTEGAFTEAAPALDKLIATAMVTGEHVRPALPQDAQAELKTRLDEIAAARRVDNRSGIAMASVEVYRLLVEHAPSAKIPREVNLLDYAGFRYDTDLKSRPVAWDDMAAAAAFGRDRWNAIEARVTDKSLHDRMTGALADMAAAAQAKDAVRAADAVRRELDLVDLLEAFFAKPPA
jgi:hypothetical protein